MSHFEPLAVLRKAVQSSWMQLMASVTKQGQWFVAQCLEVDVASQGESIEEALANLQEALELRFEDEQPPEIAELAVLAPLTIRLSA